ncbi:hypothetical protein BJF78_12610 [Pseudonocardia sp. CNS-139]|nr:hypothetical protein BJF78_12610 [Pseudonocardia sp. CNS-139]
MVDLGPRLEQDADLLAGLVVVLPGPDAELGLLAAQRVLADPADVLGEPATRSNTSRRNDMLQPMRLRTSVWYVGWPV